MEHNFLMFGGLLNELSMPFLHQQSYSVARECPPLFTITDQLLITSVIFPFIMTEIHSYGCTHVMPYAISLLGVGYS